LTSIRRTTRTAASALPTLAILLAFLGVLFLQPLPAQPGRSQVTVVADHEQTASLNEMQPVASWTDCATTAGEMQVAFMARGLKVVATIKSIASRLYTLTTLIPGISCGKWLGEQNVKQLCWWSHRPTWMPFAAYARGFVWVVTGGQTNQCKP
jgi:hypothetical protein